MLYDRVTWSPRACHHGTLRRVQYRLAKAQTRRPPDFLSGHAYQDGKREHRGDFTQEADLVHGICGTHGGYETAEVRDVRKIGGGGGGAAWGGQGNYWMECFLYDLKAIVINTHQWTTAAQDEGELSRTAEQGEERFMVKWIATEKSRVRLRPRVVCSKVT